MWAHNTKLNDANVVTVFDNQDDSDEAVLVLRLAGFRDNQIGYFSWTSSGGVTDLLERNYWMLGATLGTIAGAALGVWIAMVVVNSGRPSGWGIDLKGLVITFATFGSLFLACVGGMIGLGIPRSRVLVRELGSAASPFILAVRAGEARDQALTIIHQHGGHEMRPEDYTPRPPAHFPAGHVA
jgi:hypothetical protein